MEDVQKNKDRAQEPTWLHSKRHDIFRPSFFYVRKNNFEVWTVAVKRGKNIFLGEEFFVYFLTLLWGIVW